MHYPISKIIIKFVLWDDSSKIFLDDNVLKIFIFFNNEAL